MMAVSRARRKQVLGWCSELWIVKVEGRPKIRNGCLSVAAMTAAKHLILVGLRNCLGRSSCLLVPPSAINILLPDAMGR